MIHFVLLLEFYNRGGAAGIQLSSPLTPPDTETDRSKAKARQVWNGPASYRMGPTAHTLRPIRPKAEHPNPIPLVSHRATAYPAAAAAASAAAMAASSSRPLLRRLAELARGRVRANHRMLSSASSSTADIERASQSPAEAQAVRMTEGCVRVRISLLLPTSRSFRCIFPNL